MGKTPEEKYREYKKRWKELKEEVKRPLKLPLRTGFASQESKTLADALTKDRFLTTEEWKKIMQIRRKNMKHFDEDRKTLENLPEEELAKVAQFFMRVTPKVAMRQTAQKGKEAKRQGIKTMGDIMEGISTNLVEIARLEKEMKKLQPKIEEQKKEEKRRKELERREKQEHKKQELKEELEKRRKQLKELPKKIEEQKNLMREHQEQIEIRENVKQKLLKNLLPEEETLNELIKRFNKIKELNPEYKHIQEIEINWDERKVPTKEEAEKVFDVARDGKDGLDEESTKRVLIRFGQAKRLEEQINQRKQDRKKAKETLEHLKLRRENLKKGIKQLENHPLLRERREKREKR